MSKLNNVNSMNFHINGFLCDYTEKIIRETDYLIYLIAGAVLILRFFSDTSSVSLISSHYLLLSQVRSKSAFYVKFQVNFCF